MTDTETTKSLRSRIRAEGIRSTAKLADLPMPEGFDQSGTSWYVYLTNRAGRRMRVTFHQGSAHSHEPETEDVLDCLLSDASLVENARDFADFASELGYDTDSRKAEQTYRDTIKQTERLKRFLGNEFSLFVWHTERL